MEERGKGEDVREKKKKKKEETTTKKRDGGGDGTRREKEKRNQKSLSAAEEGLTQDDVVREEDGADQRVLEVVCERLRFVSRSFCCFEGARGGERRGQRMKERWRAFVIVVERSKLPLFLLCSFLFLLLVFSSLL